MPEETAIPPQAVPSAEIPEDPAAAAWEHAGRIAAALDDRLLAAQVIISGIDGKGHLSRDMRFLLEDCPAGGTMMFRYNLDADTDAIRELIAETAALIISGSGVPPFTAVDHEGGSVNRFRPDVADLPPAGSYWDMAQREGRRTAIANINLDSFYAGKAINRVGVNLNLAPVAEYLNDNNGVFLGDRAYGPDPVFVTEAAEAFITGMERAGILCAVKHFPGSAGTDPHLFTSTLAGDRTELITLAAPFAALIDSGHARAIMVSHSLLPALDNEHIASLSPAVMESWLRRELGFSGLIICDDFSMSAARQEGLKSEAAVVRSLAAGADMALVWPPDLLRTHRAITAAIDNNSLSRERLREAAQRIIFAKIQTGLINGK